MTNVPFCDVLPAQLVAVLRDEYERRGYAEVMTPQLYKKELWRISGHLAAYADNMYAVTPGLPDAAPPPQAPPTTVTASPAGHEHSCSHDTAAADAEVFGLKPMNCPGHCLIYAQVCRQRQE